MQEHRAHIQILSEDHQLNLNHSISICHVNNQGATDVSFDLFIHSFICPSVYPHSIQACNMPVSNNCTRGEGKHTVLENS